MVKFHFVSIPYGKGKAGQALPEKQVRGKVSIPYGKGKVMYINIRRVRCEVSIPYGKGKVIVEHGGVRYFGRINSLWER